jgi:hypothetical protein
VAHTREIGDGRVADYADGSIVGVECYAMRECFDLTDIPEPDRVRPKTEPYLQRYGIRVLT